MTVKVNDIIEVTLQITLDIPEEDTDKTVINTEDYNQNYQISYHNLRDDSFGDVDFYVEAGFTPCFCDLDGYLKDELHNDYEEITDFEILEIDTDDGEYQTAKIKVTGVNEKMENTNRQLTVDIRK